MHRIVTSALAFVCGILAAPLGAVALPFAAAWFVWKEHDSTLFGDDARVE